MKGLYILLRSEGEREGKNAGEPAFCKKVRRARRIMHLWDIGVCRRRMVSRCIVGPTPSGPAPSPAKTPKHDFFQSCAGDKVVTISRRLRNHLGVFGKRVQGENPFAKGFSPWRSAF